MIAIKKGKAPQELENAVRALRNTPDASVNYDNLGGATLGAIRKSLAEEQGYICAYCMQRIDEKSCTIEHYVARNSDDPRAEELSVSYGNMLAVCDGNRGKATRAVRGIESLTCDKHRKNAPFRRLDPLKSETLKAIRYRSDGVMASDDNDVESDINLLNLNCDAAMLPANRKAAIDSLYAHFQKVYPKMGEKAKVNHCRKLKKALLESKEKLPYVGALVYMLDKQIKKHAQ